MTKAIINKIDHYDRKSDGKPISKVSFDPMLDKESGEVLLTSPRWYDGHLDLKLTGKTARLD